MLRCTIEWESGSLAECPDALLAPPQEDAKCFDSGGRFGDLTAFSKPDVTKLHNAYNVNRSFSLRAAFPRAFVEPPTYARSCLSPPVSQHVSKHVLRSIEELQFSHQDWIDPGILQKVKRLWVPTAIDAANLVRQPFTLDSRAERVEFEVKFCGNGFEITHVTAEGGVPFEWLHLEVHSVEELSRYFADGARLQILERSKL